MQSRAARLHGLLAVIAVCAGLVVAPAAVAAPGDITTVAGFS